MLIIQGFSARSTVGVLLQLGPEQAFPVGHDVLGEVELDGFLPQQIAQFICGAYHWQWFWKYLLSKKKSRNKFGAKLGHNHHDKCNFFYEKQVSTYDHFFNLQKSYSALHWRSREQAFFQGQDAVPALANILQVVDWCVEMRIMKLKGNTIVYLEHIIELSKTMCR